MIVERFLPNKKVLIVAGVGTLLLSLPFFFSLKSEKTYACKLVGQEWTLSIRPVGRVGIIKTSPENKERECPWVEISPDYKGYMCPTGNDIPVDGDAVIREYFFFVEESSDSLSVLIVRSPEKKDGGKAKLSDWSYVCVNAWRGDLVNNYCILKTIIDCRRIG